MENNEWRLVTKIVLKHGVSVKLGARNKEKR